MRSMPAPNCVGALIRDGRHRVYAQRRSPDRRLLPGIWDIVGGHVEPGETPEQTLAREIEEETGWRLRRIEAVVAEWEWTPDERHTPDPRNRFARHERDYLVDVDGDLDAPVLEDGKHDAFAWVGPADLDLMMVGRTDGDRRLRDLVAQAVRTRLTDRLRLVPIGPEHAADLVRLHGEPGIVRWFGSSWSRDHAVEVAATKQRAWETNGTSKWMAYERGTGELVGRGGVDRLSDDNAVTAHLVDLLAGHAWTTDRLEVGWSVSPTRQRRGYATEIGQAGLDFAFGELGASGVVAFTETHNEASRAVMERLGMVEVGEVRGPGLIPGRNDVNDDAAFAVYLITNDQSPR